jgi:hypothetical protein
VVVWCGVSFFLLCVFDKPSANSCQPEPRKCMNAVVAERKEMVCAGQSKAGAKRKARSCPSVRGLRNLTGA